MYKFMYKYFRIAIGFLNKIELTTNSRPMQFYNLYFLRKIYGNRKVKQNGGFPVSL